jgi:class 3 adenylate cyclase
VLAQRNAKLTPERRMPFRIGVPMGDVTAESGHLYGDGVNVAARAGFVAREEGDVPALVENLRRAGLP